jgi:hypothetical protein
VKYNEEAIGIKSWNGPAMQVPPSNTIWLVPTQFVQVVNGTPLHVIFASIVCAALTCSLWSATGAGVMSD